MTEAGFLSKTMWLAAKDLRIETRARDTLAPMLGFAATVALVLAFALPETSSADDGVVAYVQAGFLWVTVLFAGLIGFGRTFEVERADGALDSLLLVPVDRSALFVSKALSNLAFIVVLETALLPLSALLFAYDLGSSWALLVVVAALVDLGFVAVGTLYAALAAQTRSRELLLPLLALPALVPVFIAALELTADLLLGAGFDALAARGWFGILVAFDVVFVTAGAVLFDAVLD
ncbi:MAG: heme exporter protein CcmB [Actinomycetota bacterium]|nr:heme exporter protein CcmB [Actinomycetota bacterium]